jgi:PIN domain nuclease of toxin-antitoxin system
MRLLLDTHTLLWLMEENPRLSPQACSLIRNAEQVYVSTASIWEIAVKRQIGKIEEDTEMVVARLGQAGLCELQVTNRHAIAAGRLPLLHRDPFDRLLVAQAMTEPLHLLTADKQLQAYSELVIAL